MPDLKEIKAAGVADEEMVARAMFSPSFFNRSGGVGAQAFFLTPFHGSREKDISVIRECLCLDIEEAVRRITPRSDSDKVSGYAELNVGDIRALSYKKKTDSVDVDVKATPSRYRLYHAGIVIKNHGKTYSSDDNSTIPLPPALMRTMGRLAHISTYVPFPAESEAEG